MIMKTDNFDNQEQGKVIAVWDDKFAVGIELIDTQHKKLFDLTNELFEACLAGESAAKAVFKDAMTHMVEYVRFHFGAEQKLLERINFPAFHDHKKQHDDLVKEILETAKEFNEGKKFVPNQFVRTLRDWIFSHIGFYDKQYAAFIVEQKSKGLLTDKQING